MEKTYFISLEDFNKFLKAIPQISAYTKKTKRPPLTASSFQLLFKITYYCALRINETLKLRKADFDLENKILKFDISGGRKNVPQETTIPPNLIKELENYLKNLKPENKLFNTTRQTVWKYSKNAATLAQLQLLEKIGNVKFAVLFRHSRKAQMIKDGADEDLADLKLRTKSPRGYRKYNIEDLKKWETKLEFLPSYGVVVIGDVLGTKGIWREKDPSEVIGNWTWLVKKSQEYFSKIVKNDNVTVKAFSDTIVIIGKGNDIENLIIGIGSFLKQLTFICVVYDFPIRGVFSIGDIVDSEQMMIGAAVDEAAMFYEQSDWIGFSATPSSFSILENLSKDPKYSSLIKKSFIKYDVPMKNGVEKNNWAINLNLQAKITGDLEKTSKFFNMTIEEIIHHKLQHSSAPEGSKKWKNTLLFIDHIKNTSKS